MHHIDASARLPLQVAVTHRRAALPRRAEYVAAHAPGSSRMCPETSCRKPHVCESQETKQELPGWLSSLASRSGGFGGGGGGKRRGGRGGSNFGGRDFRSDKGGYGGGGKLHNYFSITLLCCRPCGVVVCICDADLPKTACVVHSM